MNYLVNFTVHLPSEGLKSYLSCRLYNTDEVFRVKRIHNVSKVTFYGSLTPADLICILQNIQERYHNKKSKDCNNIFNLVSYEEVNIVELTWSQLYDELYKYKGTSKPVYMNVKDFECIKPVDKNIRCCEVGGQSYYALSHTVNKADTTRVSVDELLGYLSRLDSEYFLSVAVLLLSNSKTSSIHGVKELEDCIVLLNT